MRFAIISVTKEGSTIASEMAQVLKNDPTVMKVDVFHKNVKDTLKSSFYDYDCWVAIMATGIMVRTICPLIKSKLTDPAVLVVSENKKHVISLLSGHLGGANHFSIKIAGLIGAVPVITTATDLKGKLGIDTLAYQYWLQVEQPHLIKEVNQLIADDVKVELYLPKRFQFLTNHPLINRSYQIQTWDESFLRVSLFCNDFPSEGGSNKCLDLHPKRMVAGLGSKKGVTVDQVFFAIRSALQHLHLPFERLDALATADVKKDEEGIITVASQSNLPLEILSLNEIAGFENVDCTPSTLVKREFGVPGVSEPVALIRAGKQSRLILKKSAYNGVTVAIAVSRD
ncbi:MAG: cobalt-precorrin 5A hydrolase [Methanobacterium sp.]|jgi:cobalt-precorrin 5A hydrolase|uniref:cobalt-precorrin 5A hydrolase n=1 Tax=Methanobacterium sp. TaxID=2164 RepID=UPI002589142B|nr:cobalt-precorrin 5A hydrolase [Methanobacterium sp.]MCC7560950.1 cobalt-precorrin 5A hydrolase [Methanobacterium sp.]